MRKLFLSCLLFLCFLSIAISKDYNILSYGAIADGKNINTKAIQKAIDQAENEGGGRIIIPKGRFVSGTIILKSGIELHLEKGAILLGSINPDDYQKINRWQGLIMADNATNIGISGKGTIDGQGARLAVNIDERFYKGQLDSTHYNFVDKRPKVTVRPQIIEFVRCKQIVVKDIKIKNAASWVQSYFECFDVVIDNIQVDSDAYWNNDGIDIIDCKKVRITNCDINSSDDGICLKSYNYPRDPTVFCDNIYIANCKVRSSASAVKLGTSSYSGFKNVTIEKIKVYDTYRSAIALESWENGSLENVIVQDIKAVNTGNALFIRLGKRYGDERYAVLKNVTIRNMKVKVPDSRPDKKYAIRGPALPFFHNVFPVSITGLPDYQVENITVENVQITYPGGGNQAYANMPDSRLNDVPEQANKYPEFSMFGELPAWGFYVRHVNGLILKNVKVKIKKADYRPAFVFDDVKGLDLNSVLVEGDQKGQSIHFHQVEKRSK